MEVPDGSLGAAPNSHRAWKSSTAYPKRKLGAVGKLNDVQGLSLFRLCRATISEHWVLIRGGDPERGSGVDRSERVSLD